MSSFIKYISSIIYNRCMFVCVLCILYSYCLMSLVYSSVCIGMPILSMLVRWCECEEETSKAAAVGLGMT